MDALHQPRRMSCAGGVAAHRRPSHLLNDTTLACGADAAGQQLLERSGGGQDWSCSVREESVPGRLWRAV